MEFTLIPKTESIEILNQHISQLGKLDELVKNLTELVTRLESHVAEKNPKNNNNFVHDNDDDDDDIKRVSESNKGEKNRFHGENDDVGMVKGDKLGAVSVTKHSLFWLERFQFVSAVKINTQATSLNVLPFKDVEGLSKYVGVGDDLGNVYVFTRSGDVMVQFDTMTGSPVTAILIFKESGAMIGSVVSSSSPLAFLKQMLLLFTETRAESLDLRTMKLKYAPCEGLNGSHALNYVFDASDMGKAYGFTSVRELVQLLIYGIR
ncbi:hypothetical protein Tco_1022769 [Tanacetum coccineum]